MVVSGTNAVAWATASAAPHSALPPWPAYAFGGIALAGLYAALASLARIWPFGALRSPSEVLDERIRLGRDARERIGRLGLSDHDAQVEYVRGFTRTGAALERYVPAVVDDFMLADVDDPLTARSSDSASAIKHPASRQARHLRLIDAKLDVLTGARREM